MNKLFDKLLRVIIAIALTIAVWSTQSHNFYVFLHWLIFLSSIYLAYKAKDVVGIWGIRFGVIFFSACAVLFNPFMPFNLSKTTWRIIDMVVIADLLLFMNVKEFSDTLSPKGKLDFSFGKIIFWCLIIWSAATWILFYPSAIDFHKQFQLITKPTTTVKGFVTDVSDENETESETQGTRSDFWYSYSFTTTDGKKIASSASEVGGIPEEFKDLAQHPYPIDIVYLNENPENNLPKDQIRESIIDLLRTERIFMSILIFVVGVAVTFQIIKRARTKYLTEIKSVSIAIQ